MKHIFLLLSTFLVAGCVIPVQQATEQDGPIASPDPMTDEGGQGIAVGEPNPNGSGGGIMLARWYQIAHGEWCHYDAQDFEGRVFADEDSFNETWRDQLACEPTADREALPPISWDAQFRVALIAPTSGCLGSKLEALDVDMSGDHYVVEYRFTPPQGDACATAMSKPVVYLEIYRAFGDQVEVEFRSV